MPVTVSYPGLYIEELPSSVHTINAAPTSITVFVGYVHPFQGECAAKGDLGEWGKPIRIFNFEDYRRIFGDLYRNEYLGDSKVGYAVQQFFLNGGSDAYVVGLRPKFYGPNANDVAAVVGAAAPLSGIVFTARELTDQRKKIRITIQNVVKRVVDDDTADVMITYGSQVETYRGVPAASFGARLAKSRLVGVAPEGA